MQIENKVVKKVTDKWPFFVCGGTVITFVAGIGHVNSFGLLYNDFIIETNSSAQSLTTAHGVFAIMLAVGGLIVNVLLNKLSLRLSGLLGSLLFISGSFSTIFIMDIGMLSITFGFLQGIGFGMMVPVCYATLNYIFVEKRTTVMSICKALQGIILMGYPQLMKMLIMTYGLRGTLLILSGISTHTLAGMMTMHRRRRIKMRSANKTDAREGDDLLDGNREADNKDVHKFFKFRQYIYKLLNLKVLQDPTYCNICLGQSFVNFSDLSFFILHPMLLFQYGYSKEEVATCISIGAGADVIGRCGLAAVSAAFSIRTRCLFYCATLGTFLARIFILQLEIFPWVASWTAVLGFLRAWLHVTSPLVIASHVQHEDFPGAYAFLTLASGVVNMSFSPLTGLLKDIYGDYVPTFYVLCLCCLPCLLGWPLELILVKRCKLFSCKS